MESRAGKQTEMFECEAQTVIASTDTEKEKPREKSVFPRTDDQSYLKISSPTIHPTNCDIDHYRTRPLFHIITRQGTKLINLIKFTS